ncbi:hypothetical protein U1Q18_046190, partial [Sarracenia purpurea var. burkii]
MQEQKIIKSQRTEDQEETQDKIVDVDDAIGIGSGSVKVSNQSQIKIKSKEDSRVSSANRRLVCTLPLGTEYSPSTPPTPPISRPNMPPR